MTFRCTGRCTARLGPPARAEDSSRREGAGAALRPRSNASLPVSHGAGGARRPAGRERERFFVGQPPGARGARGWPCVSPPGRSCSPRRGASGCARGSDHRAPAPGRPESAPWVWPCLGGRRLSFPATSRGPGPALPAVGFWHRCRVRCQRGGSGRRGSGRACAELTRTDRPHPAPAPQECTGGGAGQAGWCAGLLFPSFPPHFG